MWNIEFLSRRWDASRGTHRRRPTHRFQVEALECFETRVVPSTTGVDITTPVLMQNGNSDPQACATFTNNTDHAVTVAIADYSYSGAFLTPQTFVGDTTATLQPGASTTLCVRLACNTNNQVDAIVTDATHPILTSNFGNVPDYRDYTLKYAFLTVVCPTKGNEGLGNGVDPPPPGLVGYPQNDDPAVPGNPQFQGGGGKSGNN